mmetsp:Transcript_14036/g.29364  ORF Transcript_14036/g.29364 Transcript_14036/m.29364 type:complete len:206 (-) Transcript_14036:355-972(-)
MLDVGRRHGRPAARPAFQQALCRQAWWLGHRQRRCIWPPLRRSTGKVPTRRKGQDRDLRAPALSRAIWLPRRARVPPQPLSPLLAGGGGGAPPPQPHPLRPPLAPGHPHGRALVPSSARRAAPRLRSAPVPSSAHRAAPRLSRQSRRQRFWLPAAPYCRTGHCLLHLPACLRASWCAWARNAMRLDPSWWSATWCRRGCPTTSCL